MQTRTINERFTNRPGSPRWPFIPTMTLAVTICPSCLGNGRHAIPHRYCFTCGGRGTIARTTASN